jgi:hypothetical protein
MCTDFEKLIYNEFLKESRKAKNQPYRLRKDFTKIDNTTQLSLKKLSYFFIKHKDINPTEFFKAPYQIYSPEETFRITFYTTQKAIHVYKIYKESLKKVDSPEITDMIHHVNKNESSDN